LHRLWHLVTAVIRMLARRKGTSPKAAIRHGATSKAKSKVAIFISYVGERLE